VGALWWVHFGSRSSNKQRSMAFDGLVEMKRREGARERGKRRTGGPRKKSPMVYNDLQSLCDTVNK